MKILRKMLLVLWWIACAAFMSLLFVAVLHADVNPIRIRVTGGFAHVVEVQRFADGGHALTGALFTCDSAAFDVRGVTLRLADTVYARLPGRSRSHLRTDGTDTCHVEQFAACVHGGVLRRWMEAKGVGSITFRGGRYAMKFVVPARVRTEVAAIFGWKRGK